MLKPLETQYNGVLYFIVAELQDAFFSGRVVFLLAGIASVMSIHLPAKYGFPNLWQGWHQTLGELSPVRAIFVFSGETFKFSRECGFNRL